MKTVRTILGNKKIGEQDHHLVMIQLRDILDAHRSALINRLVADLPSYIDYKFSVKVNAKELEVIKDKLSYLKNSSVDMDKYKFIFDSVMSNETTYVDAAPFYKEIDDSISIYLNESQLKLVK
jgi:hypothetical protein